MNPTPPLVRQTSPLGTLLKSPPWTAPWRKPRLFLMWALAASILAAILGEGWLALTRPPAAPLPPPPPQAVVLAIDTSGSMDDGSLDEVKTAAKAFVARQDTSRTRVGVVEFGSDARVVSPVTRDKAALSGALDSLQSAGVTRMDLGLQSAQSVLQSRSPLPTPEDQKAERTSVLLFTDGVPESDDSSVDAATLTNGVAATLKTASIKLVAIGSQSADTDYLAGLTGSPKLVFSTTQGSFDEAFARAEAEIKNTGTAQLISSGAQNNVDDSRALWRLSGWNAILGAMLALSLVLAQARLTRAFWNRSDTLAVLMGAGLGALAGAIGQSTFASLAAEGSIGLALGRLLGWSLLGAGAGAALAWSLPNVRRAPIILGGTIGGVAGAVAFAVGARLGGDVVGRWAGALAIGAGVGLMIALAEVAARRAWISVSFSSLDSYDLALGTVPVAVGSDRGQCRAFVPAIEPVAARYGFENGGAFLSHPDGRRELLNEGDARNFGKARVTLHLERAAPGTSVQIQNTPFPFGPPLQAQPNVTAPPVTAQGQVAPPPPFLAGQAAPQSPVNVPAPSLKWKWDGGEATLHIERQNYSLGRANDNDIVLGAPSVSSHHARLELRAGRWILTDLGSTNGTFVGETRLQAHLPTPLNIGQSVRLGALICRFERD